MNAFLYMLSVLYALTLSRPHKALPAPPMPPVTRISITNSIVAAPIQYSAKILATCAPSLQPRVAYYEWQQTTQIMSQVFFPFTNTPGPTVTVTVTNQTGRFRVRAVIGHNGQTLQSPWCYY